MRQRLTITVEVPDGVRKRLEGVAPEHRERRLGEWILANWKARGGTMQVKEVKRGGRSSKS